MKKNLIYIAVMLLAQGCSILSEITALTRCEFSFHSATDPRVCGINIAQKNAFSDFNLLEGQTIAGSILRRSLPFEITANVEVLNPGATTAAVNSMEWIAFIDDIQIAEGILNRRVEVSPGGGKAMIPVMVQADLFEFLEGDSPRTMLNFALNLVDAGNQPTRFSMKIKPSVLIGGQPVYYPGYFTISREFSSGNP